MSFDPNVRLDPGQISDRRGIPGGRGGIAIGGGGLGIALLLIYTLLGGDPNDLGSVLDPGAVVGPESSALATDCKTGQDANQRDDCRILGYVSLATNGDVPAALEAYRARRAERVGHVQATTHRRDRLRYLHPLARRAIMGVAGHRVFRAHYRPLLAPP